MGPLPRQSRLQIAQLSDLDLQLTLEGTGALREDIENQLAAIDDTDFELVLQIARLCGAQGVVENRQGRRLLMRQIAHFGGLAAADKGPWIDGFEPLLYLSGDFGTGGFGERTEFGQRVLGSDAVGGSGFDTDENRPFGTVC